MFNLGRAPLLTVLMIFVFSPAPASAQTPKVSAFDLDGDGRITRTEFISGRDARFNKFDRNGDRAVSAQDFPPNMAGRPLAALVGRMMAQADANKDGRVTRDELGTSGTPFFEKADADGNGVVEQSEVARFRSQLARDR
jgi:hypothetical protein